MNIRLLVAYALCFSQLSMGRGIYYGVVTHQNKRPYQEDRFTVVPKFNNGAFFGIYDGHGGDKTASFLQDNVHKYCAVNLKKDKVHPCQTLKNAFSSLEVSVLEKFADGATALALYIDVKNRLYCAWVGDTRLVLEESGAVGFATRDHKPNDPQELQRIKSAGGEIQKIGVWRVGGLAISRSIGDAALKKNYPGQIIAIPDCEQKQLNQNNHFLIMASDGLWDVVSSEEAIKMVQDQLKRKKLHCGNNGESITHCADLDAIAGHLQDVAIERGSGDNITVCVIQFDWSEEGNKHTPSLFQRFWNWLQGK